MNTATMLAATAVFGFTWGYQPLDERSTEYLIQLRPHELTVLADGTMQITTDVPDAAQPIGRIRIIVGNEELPRESLPREARAPRPLDWEPGDANSTQPAVAIDAMTDSGRGQFDRADRRRDPLAGEHTTHDPIDPPARGRYGERYRRSPRYGERTVPPDRGPALVSPFGDQGVAGGVLGGQPVPPAGANPSVLDYREEAPFASTTEPPDWRNLLEVRQETLSPPPLEQTAPSIPGLAAGPPLTTDPTYEIQGATQPSVGASVNQFGPALSPPGAAAALDPLTERPQRDANLLTDNLVAEGPSTNREYDGANPSPAGTGGVLPEKLTAAQQKMSSWRLWALALGSCAFGLLWCNVYQWGIYKSVRRRYLTLLRRTGEV